MQRGAKIVVGLSLVAVGVLLFLGFAANKGEVVQEAASFRNGPLIKVRMLQTNPWTIHGLLGFDEVIYRAEYYPRPGARMLACISLTGESLHPGKKIEVRWRDERTADLEIDDVTTFSWTGKEWRIVPARPH